jgi:hypothetical protein
MKTIKKAQTGAKVKKPATKPKEDKYKGLGGEIGRPIFSDKEQRERRKKLGLPTSAAEEKAYYKKMEKEGAKNGKTMSKAKNGKSFPDLNKDGKVTKADILKGRGVIAKKGATVKKAAASMKKCKYGCK